MAISKADLKKQADLQEAIKAKLAVKLEKEMTDHQKKIEKSAAMFKNTRVTSCSQILQKGGKTICMSFNTGNTKPVDPSANKMSEVSSFAAD